MTDTSNILETLSQVALMATNQYVIMFVLITGFIFLRKASFGRAFYIMAFTIILNPFLKSLFQVPHANAEGWAFPSGHMQTACALWMWLAWEYKHKTFNICAAALLCAIGFALVNLGYHTPADIAGAAAGAAATLALYNFCLNKFSWTKEHPPLLGLAMAVLSIPLIIATPNATQMLYIWLAFGALIGFSIGWFICNKEKYQLTEETFKSKLTLFSMAILGLVAFEYFFENFASETPLNQATHYLLIALWLTGISQALFSQLRRVKK